MTTLRILVAADLAAPSFDATWRAMQLAATLRARVTVLHVLELAEHWPGSRTWSDARTAELTHELERRLARLVAQAPGEAASVVPSLRVVVGRPDDRIAAAAEDADLLVLAPYGDSGVAGKVLGSTTSRLVRRSRIPVLVVRTLPTEAYRRVLVATDFSTQSAAALAWVRVLAPGADIVLLHAAELPHLGRMMLADVAPDALREYEEEEHALAVAQLARVVREAGLDPARVRCVVRSVAAWEAAITIAQEEGCDLVCVGKHGTHLLEDLLLGSVTEHLLTGLDRDLLVTTARTERP